MRSTRIALMIALAGAALSAGAAQAQSAVPGEAQFRQRCGSCHTVDPARRHGVGPNLSSVMSRAPATATGYNYSQGMRALTARWTPQNMDSFLAAPTRAAPGTRMTLGVANPADRAAIIAYLRTR